MSGERPIPPEAAKFRSLSADQSPVRQRIEQVASGVRDVAELVVLLPFATKHKAKGQKSEIGGSATNPTQIENMERGLKGEIVSEKAGRRQVQRVYNRSAKHVGDKLDPISSQTTLPNEVRGDGRRDSLRKRPPLTS